MDLIKVTIPKYARVLLLEDSEMRIEWFKKRIKKLHVCSSVQSFKDYFDTKPMVDFIFWDHDLGEGGTGLDAAKFLVERFGISGSRWGLIHSWNNVGATTMQQVITGSICIPFGSFEL